VNNNTTIMNVNVNSFSFENSGPIISDINFDIPAGSVIGIVGDSGCGKTTLGKLLVNYFNINGDNVHFNGQVEYYDKNKVFNICDPSKEYYQAFSVPPVQMIFQDPKTSINLKMTVYNLIQESLSLSTSSTTVEKLTSKLLIDESLLYTVAKNLSGGQRRRLGIAKIMAGLSTLPSDIPKIIIADEPVASLDASIKHEIMKCIIDLKYDGYTIIVISHDILLVKNISDMILVMDKVNGAGELVEIWNPNDPPKTDKTKQLINDSNHINNYLSELKKIFIE